MKVVITGASGMVGRGVLLECLDHPKINEVLVIVRKSLEIEHPKLKELIHPDFSDFTEVKEQLNKYDACYACMGVSAAGLKEETYKTLTYNYTLALAKVINLGATFIYVSGEGTDSSEKGRSMWARIKGKTENDLLAVGFKHTFMFRPGAIIPLRGIKSRTKIYQFVYDYLMWLVKFAKWIAPNSVVNTTQIGLAMIHVTEKGYKKNILKPKDIISLAGKRISV